MINKDTTVLSVMNAPLFHPYGKFIFPTGYKIPNPAMKIGHIDSLLPYHSQIDEQTTIEVVRYFNSQVEHGETIFYDLYSDKEKRQDPSKEKTGLFYFKGKKNAPFALISAGGGFLYVGSIHESFPHALELSKHGYNAFALQYRTDSANTACEDLAAAIAFIFENAKALEVDTKGYSLWGGSAGARMAAYLGTYGTESFGQSVYPRPSAIIMQYTGHSDYSTNDPATYACVGEHDGIADWRVMKRRLERLSKMGIATQFHKYPNLGHGFGLGIHTPADGWIDEAILFWQKQGEHHRK